MDQTYTIELTGKQMVLLMNCIDERLNSNTLISQHTGKSRNNENRTLRSLQRYLRNIKHPEKVKHNKNIDSGSS